MAVSERIITEATTGGSVGIADPRTYTFAHPPNELQLECGRTLGPITLAYETYGRRTRPGTTRS